MSRDEARELMLRLKKEAEQSGYLLNPDEELVLDLMEGLIANEKRYGYWACPCREADGTREADLDIICPCNYRDPDLDEYGACYCGLYVSEEIAECKRSLKPIPERRFAPEEKPPVDTQSPTDTRQVSFSATNVPVHRCVVCGYLCARNTPPLKCPICKADKDRFVLFS